MYDVLYKGWCHWQADREVPAGYFRKTPFAHQGSCICPISGGVDPDAPIQADDGGGASTIRGSVDIW